MHCKSIDTLYALQGNVKLWQLLYSGTLKENPEQQIVFRINKFVNVVDMCVI